MAGEYIAIYYPKNAIIGGLGDRIVGLISCHMIAKLMNKEFAIYWKKENVRKYLDYSKYDITRRNTGNVKFQILNCIDPSQVKKYKPRFQNIKKTFGNILFLANMEISQYFYSNPHLLPLGDFGSRMELYKREILKSYSSLWRDILKPTQYLKERIGEILRGGEEGEGGEGDEEEAVPIIGIQIRAGDKYMVTNKRETHSPIKDPENEIPAILREVKNHIERNIGEYKIFLTSDYQRAFDFAKEVWGREEEGRIYYVDDVVQHIDRTAVKDDMSKIFMDAIILSQYTNRMYISGYSNFGRIAALSSNHNEIFDLKTNPLRKIQLLSKTENLSLGTPG